MAAAIAPAVLSGPAEGADQAGALQSGRGQRLLLKGGTVLTVDGSLGDFETASRDAVMARANYKLDRVGSANEATPDLKVRPTYST